MSDSVDVDDGINLSELDKMWLSIESVQYETWRDYANCMDSDQAPWLAEIPSEETLRTCNGCAVRLECLDNASLWQDGGVRGGLSESQRLKLTRHRTRHKKAFEFDLAQAGVEIESPMQLL